MLNCRALSSKYAVVVADYSAQCGVTTHVMHALVALAILVLFALGVPLALLAKMTRARVPACLACCGPACSRVMNIPLGSWRGIRHTIPQNGHYHERLASDASTENRCEMVALFVSEDLRCSVEGARDAVTEIMGNESYSVVMAGFRPRCFWWECIDGDRNCDNRSEAHFQRPELMPCACTLMASSETRRLSFFWTTSTTDKCSTCSFLHRRNQVSKI